jgi:hypothetical protein
MASQHGYLRATQEVQKQKIKSFYRSNSTPRAGVPDRIDTSSAVRGVAAFGLWSFAVQGAGPVASLRWTDEVLNPMQSGRQPIATMNPVRGSGIQGPGTGHGDYDKSEKGHGDENPAIRNAVHGVHLSSSLESGFGSDRGPGSRRNYTFKKQAYN